MPFSNKHEQRGQLSVTLTGRDHYGKVSGKSFLEEGLLREELDLICMTERKERTEWVNRDG